MIFSIWQVISLFLMKQMQTEAFCLYLTFTNTLASYDYGLTVSSNRQWGEAFLNNSPQKSRWPSRRFPSPLLEWEEQIHFCPWVHSLWLRQTNEEEKGQAVRHRSNITAEGKNCCHRNNQTPTDKLIQSANQSTDGTHFLATNEFS